MKELFRPLTRLMAATALYLALLCFVWLAYVHLFRVNVVFYAAIGAAALALLPQALLACATPLLRGFSPLEKLQHLASCALIGYIVAISVPTVLDRSLSFYILEKLQQRGGGIRLSKFEQIFTTEYMREHRLVDIRLTEQSESGTIAIDRAHDCVKLTPRGERLAKFSRFFRQNLLPRQRLLLGEYTDALIDPFARSDAAPDYLCE
jgi:hypothetical protein